MKTVKPLYIAILILMAILTLVRLGHTQQTKEQDTATISTSGASVTFQDRVGSQTNSFEMVVGGTPATVNVTIVGCMRGGTCSATLTTSTSITSAILAVSGGPYDFYRITGTFTGGSSPTLIFNRTGTVAKSLSGGTFSGTVASGTSLVPTGTGVLASDELWLIPGIVGTSVAFTSNTGGALNSNIVRIQYTLNTLAGETLPSSTFFTSGAGPCASSACQATVTAPTLPSGYTGYTVYSCQSASVCTPVRQATGAACVNITGSCVISSIGAGPALPTTVTAYAMPPNVQGYSGLGGWTGTGYFPKVDGNYYPWLGVEISSCDATNGPPLPCGTPMFTHRTWWNDGGTNSQFSPTMPFKNSMVTFAHLAGTGTTTTNQDRAVSFFAANPLLDSATRYAMEGIQGELDFNCNACTINGSPDGEVTAASFQVSDLSTTNYAPQIGSNVIRAQYFRQNNGGTGTAGMTGVHSIMTNNGTANAGAAQFAAFLAEFAGTGTNPGVFGIGFKCGWGNSASKMGTLNICYYGATNGFTPTANTDYFIRNDVRLWNSDLYGEVWLRGINEDDLVTIPVKASLGVSGSVSTSLATATVPTGATCTGGASQYTYQVVYVDGNGGTTSSATFNTGTTCLNPLTSGNPGIVSGILQVGSVSGYDHVDIYRTAGPMSTGKIGTITSATAQHLAIQSFGFNDTGFAGDGTTPPGTGINSTGSANFVGLLSSGSTQRQTGSDFTTSSGTLVTWKTFQLLPGAKSYSFDCRITYSQQTAAAGLLLGFQSATVAPTSMMASAQIYSTNTGTSTQATSVVTTTTATTVLTGAVPAAINTNFQARLYGTIEAPANPAGDAFNIMVATANVADQITILRGSYCQLY